jgi:hypothetical protein
MARPLREPAASWALVALLLSAPGAAEAIDPGAALDALRIPSDTLARVEAGQFVEVALPTQSDRDLNVGIAFLVAERSPATLTRTVRAEKRGLRADHYVSQGYNAEQAIVAFLPVDQGTLVIYTNHTSTDQVAGFGGGTKRAIGRTLMAGQLKRIFETTRAGLGQYQQKHRAERHAQARREERAPHEPEDPVDGHGRTAVTAMNELPDSVEVAVVGFGPVGATIANLLGQYGVRTLVVDRATDILMMPRAITLDNEALRVLQLAGLSAGAFDTVAIPYVRMHSPYIGEFAQLNTAGALDGHPKLVTFYQPDLEAALRRRLREYPHVTTRLGMELVDFCEEGAGVRINLRDSYGNLATTHARYMIGADGASSAVRRQIGMEFDGHTYAEDWLIVDARNVERPIDHI